uniref:Metallo-beta-lactamase domain-containing protein 1 n=1 Tax=Phallusia mammillata TaxID=59560 RepID=A0A6F9DJN7_9ASCI|nr:metallo-beta-lactamase domain-containing protein 1-like [Phallusia mammillata]
MCFIKVLQEGYCRPKSDQSFVADCSVTLVTCEIGLILVDTSGPWNAKAIASAIENAGFKLCDIKLVVGTHGHSDHIGNLNLFPTAKFIVGFDIFEGNVYESFDFKKDLAEYKITDSVTVIPTPGHTNHDVSVVVKNTELGTVVVAGDLFENENDIQNPNDWQSLSESIQLQEVNRQKVLAIADYIVPGHGKMFKVVRHP